MSRFARIIAEQTDLSPAEVSWLAQLVDEWHLLADLSFSDLILWVPDRDPNVYWAVKQIRPTTGPTALEDDVVGDDIAYDPEHLVTEAFLSQEICETSNNQPGAGTPADVHAIPVVHDGRCIGVVEQHTNRLGVRAPGALEDAYMEAATIMANMVWRGRFPHGGQSDDPPTSPRVGDGMVRLDELGNVTFASPNAVSAYRRLGLTGDLEGERLRDITLSLTQIARGPVDAGPAVVFGARVPAEADFDGGTASIRLRFVPLVQDGQPVGSLVLCRDTTELRSRERLLVTKDATIREIHHRVKNNLQTVAALLRLQSRRITHPEARGALSQAMSRVQAIAVVHEILSQAYEEVVAFDDVADRMLRMVGDLASTRGKVVAQRVGSFGDVPADVATSLSLVITELCQNAVEHGHGQGSGCVDVVPTHTEAGLVVDVLDDGQGLPEGFSLAGSRALGLALVGTPVAGLGGTFVPGANPSGQGSRARVVLPPEAFA